MHTVLNHPLVAHRVTLMRDRATPHKLFRELVDEITTFLAYEALRDVKTRPVEVETPIAMASGKRVDEPNIIIVPILRAGMGMVGSMLGVLPYAKVGVLGMQRNEKTAEPVTYYSKVPPAKSGEELAIVVDPMLATGGSLVDAVNEIKAQGAKNIKCMCIIAAPEGVAAFTQAHPDVQLYVGSIDRCLNSDAYICPGLGDAGDRIFGTK